MKPILQKRELTVSGYRWEHRGKELHLVVKTRHIARHDDENDTIAIKLNKIAAMSLSKFLPNYLDKMRIEESKDLRLKIRKMREKNKQKRNALRQRLIAAKARKVK
jgi:hypothetical protein